jgi:hypothetical protein
MLRHKSGRYTCDSAHAVKHRLGHRCGRWRVVGFVDSRRHARFLAFQTTRFLSNFLLNSQRRGRRVGNSFFDVMRLNFSRGCFHGHGVAVKTIERRGGIFDFCFRGVRHGRTRVCTMSHPRHRGSGGNSCGNKIPNRRQTHRSKSSVKWATF